MTIGFAPALVVAQVAIAMVVLAGAGLLMRSFIRLLEVNPGFNAQNLVTISTQVPAASGTAAQRSVFYRDVKDKLLTLPGVDGRRGSQPSSVNGIEYRQLAYHRRPARCRAATPGDRVSCRHA